MKKQLLISAVPIFILARLCFPQESPLSKRDTGTITGAVMSRKDQPVAGAVIILCNQRGGIPVCQVTLADQKRMPEKLYRRIEYVLRVNKEKASEVLREYLKGGTNNREVATALYRGALRLDPAAIKKTMPESQRD